MAVNKPPSSMKKLLDKSLRKSKIFLSMMLTPLSTLNERALTTAITKVMPATISVALLREVLNSSEMKVMGISLNEMVLVRAAKMSNTKNNIAHK